jgi:oligoribonuclease NrnB/cAMP/cGMP phosphodiesterase (DHH superfamily)
MTPKEKAFDLILKFQHPLSEESDTDCLHIKVAKEFALIAVDEIIEATSIKYEYNNDFELIITGKKPLQYWLDVKQEIEKL